MQVSSSQVIPRPGPRPSDAKMMAPGTERSSKARPEPPTTSIKLPLLQGLTNTNQTMTSSDEVSPGSGQPSARVNISRLSQNEALSLLQQYNRIVGDTSKSQQPELPHIKMNMRPDGHKPIPARDRFTTKSLDRVERAGRKVFTEGLSSKSKYKDPTLAMHRRDIIGANMPDTVRLARERSNIVFGLNRYRPRKQRHDMAGPRSKAFKGLRIEPASVTASEIMAPLAVPQKVELGDVWEENTHKSESRITRMLKTMEERYGRDVIGQGVPSTPSVQSVDYLTSSTSVTTPVMTPRKTPLRVERSSKPNLSVVSLGESLADLPQKPRPTVKIPRQSRDNNYNQLERYKQHIDDKKPSRFEIRYHTVRERKPGVHYPFFGEMRPVMGHRGKTKSGAKKKRQIVVSLKDITGSLEQDEDEETEGNEEDRGSKQDGKFNVEGVKGVGTGPRLWSPSSVSTSASVANPPPSVEAGLFDLEFPHVKDPAAMFTVDEEKCVDDTPRLAVEANDHLSDGHSSLVSSTHLSVPSLNAGKECRPLVEAPWGERPPRKDDPMTGVDCEPLVTNGTPESPRRGTRVSSEMKVTTLELFPGSSNSHVRPTISISGSDEVEEDLQRQRGQEVREKAEGQASQEDGSGSQDNTPSVTNQTNVHNQSIRFISPLQTQRNAKRQ